MSLRTYRSKRDFKRTTEPDDRPGDGRPPTRSRREPKAGDRFVIHRHRARRLHYDLRLEIGGVLASWAVPRGPTLDPAAKRLAVQVEDHPFGYFRFEGVIPAGQYGGGDVIVWDWGNWRPEPGQPDAATALRAGELKLVLEGEKLHGGIRPDPDRWMGKITAHEAEVASGPPPRRCGDPRLGRGGPSGKRQERPHERGRRGGPTRQATPIRAQDRLIPIPPSGPALAMLPMAATTTGSVAALRVERLRQHNRVAGRRRHEVRVPRLRRS